MAVYTGKIIDWRELGAKPGPIRAIGREATDASRQALAREIKEFNEIAYGASVKLVHLDTQLIDLLDRYPTSLGFLNRSALFGAATPLKPLAFGAVQGNPDTLADGRYPLALEFGLVHKAGALSAAGKAFVAFVYSPSGERILRDHGVLPLPAAN
ncbi:MAG: substrate-binding domain-containing protein [Burkholderiaceae bacterium]